MYLSEAFIEVGRCAKAVRTLFFQVLGKSNLHAIAIRNLGVKVFIKGLRSPKPACVCKTEVGVGRGIVAQIYARAEYQVRNKVVFV